MIAATENSMAKRVRPARNYQRQDEPIRLIAHRGKPAIRRDLKSALKHLASIVPEAKILHELRSGSYGRVKDVIDWPHFGEVLKAVFARIAAVRMAGAALGVRKINGAFHGKRRRVRFLKSVGAHPAAILETMAEVVRFYSSTGWTGLEKKEPLASENQRPKSREETPKVDGGKALAPLAAIHSLFDEDALYKADIGNRFNFDAFALDTQERVRGAQDVLIRQLTIDARDTVDAIVQHGVRNGLSAEAIAKDVREIIGLTDRQAQAVMNYRTMLENQDRGALARQLRNSDLDSTVRAALDGGQPLDEAFIERAVRDYEDNYLDHRAETIAQTESVRAASAGLEDSYQQAIDRGAIPGDAVRRHWQVALDERTCPVCLSIPDLNPDGVPVGVAFDSEDGPVDEPPVHVNCRCSIDYITDLDMVSDSAEAAA